MKKTLITLWALLVTIGIIFPNFYGSLFDTFKLGSTNFPTSLDSLTNPNPTDSVATVSHSAQHANANDAIEAIESKVGTGATTAVLNSLFAGNGSGTSIWTTFATSTNFTATGLGVFGTLLSQGSSTIVGNFNITGNSTTTNSTTTIAAFTSYATSTKWFGGGLSSCSSNNFLTWTNGSFGCETGASVSPNDIAWRYDGEVTWNVSSTTKNYNIVNTGKEFYKVIFEYTSATTTNTTIGLYMKINAISDDAYSSVYLDGNTLVFGSATDPTGWPLVAGSNSFGTTTIVLTGEYTINNATSSRPTIRGEGSNIGGGNSGHLWYGALTGATSALGSGGITQINLIPYFNAGGYNSDITGKARIYYLSQF